MMTERGMLGVFNISTGYVILTFTGNEDVDIAIVSRLVGLPNAAFSVEKIQSGITKQERQGWLHED